MSISFGFLWVTNLGNGWSKSIVLENKVVISFDFRHGAKKSGHLDHPLQGYAKYFSTYFNTFDEKLVGHHLHKKNTFINDMNGNSCGLNSQ